MARPSPAALDASALPPVDRVLGWPGVNDLSLRHGRTAVLAAARAELGACREKAKSHLLTEHDLEPARLATAIAARVAAATRPRLQLVWNLTGTVLHTNLGRAPLPREAIDAVARAQGEAVALEYDVTTGKRGDRDELVAPRLAALCAAEHATVVNNCAAGLLLTLGALARRREVIVSRGELIEIGGSFRLPDLMRAAGARLIEVGTTNRTHLADYESAISARTAMILKVHPSNYRITGFAAEVPSNALAGLAAARGLPFVVDLGSGALIDLAAYGLPAEPVVADVVAAGADLVLFSGDKLLGGPQAGLIIGRETLIRRLNRDPLKRALRPGKLTYAALDAVLALYQSPESLPERLTTLRLLTRGADSIRATAERLCPVVAAALPAGYVAAIEPVASEIGSGAQPGETLPSYAVAIRPRGTQKASLTSLAGRLRRLPRPILGRLAGDCLFLDMRCLEETAEADFSAEIGRLNR